MANPVPDRSLEDRSLPLEEPADGQYKASCGHEDMIGYFTNNVCGKCARKAHKKVMGR